jgi:hypothetical protein
LPTTRMARTEYKQDIGITFQVTFNDSTGTARDISNALNKYILFTSDEDGSTLQQIGVFTNSGTDGKLQYVTNATTDLTNIGGYKFQGVVEFTDGTVYSSSVDSFIVRNRLATLTLTPTKVSKIPLTPGASNPSAANYAAVWAEVQADVGAGGIISNFDPFANWQDAFHQSAIVLLTNGEKIYAQISRTEIGTQSEATFLNNLSSLLALYSGKFWGINLCVEAEGSDYNILTTDPNSKQSILTAAHNLIKATDSSIKTSISFSVQGAIDSGISQASIVSAILDDIGVDQVAMTDYPSSDIFYQLGISDLVQSRYSGIRDAMPATTELVVAEFGYGDGNELTTEGGRSIQKESLERVFDMVTQVLNPCPLIVWTFPYDLTWLAGGAFGTHGLRTTTDTVGAAESLFKPAWHMWEAIQENDLENVTNRYT